MYCVAFLPPRFFSPFVYADILTFSHLFMLIFSFCFNCLSFIFLHFISLCLPVYISSFLFILTCLHFLLLFIFTFSHFVTCLCCHSQISSFCLCSFSHFLHCWCCYLHIHILLSCLAETPRLFPTT